MLLLYINEGSVLERSFRRTPFENILYDNLNSIRTMVFTGYRQNKRINVTLIAGIAKNEGANFTENVNEN